MKQNQNSSPTVIDLKNVKAYAKPFIDKVLYPFLTLKFAEEGVSFNPENITAWQSDVIEELQYHLNILFSEFRQEAQEKKKNSTSET